jgi:cis-3-alkyl-4-acyloxetan-2-one decarboxylase
MNQTTLSVDGVTVFVEGSGAETLLMIHGWPDTYRLWDSTVAALAADFRCARFSLPGFDIAQAPRASSLNELVETIHRVADAVSPDQPVTLVLHDWGCIFGYEFAAQYATRVSRIVAIDIGDYNSAECVNELTSKAKFQVFSYQFWLALSWQIGTLGGGRLANWMVRTMARKMRCPTPSSEVHWQMNYPYAMRWFGLKGGLKSAAPVGPHCPIFYAYGARKPFMFQSTHWLKKVADVPGSTVERFVSGHWVMVEEPELFNQHIGRWLGTQTAAVQNTAK